MIKAKTIHQVMILQIMYMVEKYLNLNVLVIFY